MKKKLGLIQTGGLGDIHIAEDLTNEKYENEEWAMKK